MFSKENYKSRRNLEKTELYLVRNSVVLFDK